MVKIGMLAFGEAGSQVAEHAVSKGVQAVVVNTAKIDFDKFKNVNVDSRIHLEGWEGAGRNRDEGKTATLTYAERINEMAVEKLSDCDMVYVVASCGGGTGSGSIPIGIEIVSGFKNYVGVITTLPEMSESVKAQMNSTECFSELSQFEQLGSIFVLDNEKLVSVLPDKTRAERHRVSKEGFIDSLIEIASLTTQQSYGPNFDKNDFLEIINERGCAAISKIHIPIDEVKNQADLTTAIKESWKNNFHPDFEKGKIVKAAILGKIPEEAMKLIDVKSIFSEVGMPFDVMEAYYDNKGNDNHYTFYTILSGLSFPYQRLNEMESLTKSVEEEMEVRIGSARTQTYQSGVSTSKFNRAKTQPKKESLTERLARFK